VTFHLVEFCGRQFAWFIENVFRYRELTHVVKQGGRFNGAKLVVVRYAEALCQLHRVHLYTPNVSVSDLILRIDSHRQRFDRRHVQLV
jgi:hypothetical protein